MVVKRKDLAMTERPAYAGSERWLGEGWVTYRRARVWEPPTDVYENEEGLVVQIELAGVNERDVQITLSERMLVVSGVRRDPESKQAYHQMEIRYGEFRTEVYLPWVVDADQVDAEYEDGFLRILLPRPPRRRLTVL